MRVTANLAGLQSRPAPQGLAREVMNEASVPIMDVVLAH